MYSANNREASEDLFFSNFFFVFIYWWTTQSDAGLIRVALTVLGIELWKYANFDWQYGDLLAASGASSHPNCFIASLDNNYCLVSTPLDSRTVPPAVVRQSSMAPGVSKVAR